MGMGLPKADYDPELGHTIPNDEAMKADIEDQFWRFMFLFPVLINLFMLTSFCFFIR